MKTKLLNLFATACLVAGMAGAAPAFAQSLDPTIYGATGTNFLSAPSNTDVFTFKCPTNSLGLVATVNDLPFIGNSTPVIVTILKLSPTKQSYAFTTDLIEDNESRGAVLQNGPGLYYVTYRQAGASDDYNGTLYCLNKTSTGVVPYVPGSFRRILNEQ